MFSCKLLEPFFSVMEYVFCQMVFLSLGASNK